MMTRPSIVTKSDALDRYLAVLALEHPSRTLPVASLAQSPAESMAPAPRRHQAIRP